MLDCIHAGRVGEFRRVLRACAIAVSQGRQALALAVPPGQGPDAFLRAFHAHCREKGGRPIRLVTLGTGGRTAAQRLAAQLGIEDALPRADLPLRDLLGARDRWFDRLRAALAEDLATDGVSTGPGILVVDGDVAAEPTFLAFLGHLCPRQAPWRTLPSVRSAVGQFVVVVAAEAGLILPEGVETLSIRPFDGEDLKAVADVAAQVLMHRAATDRGASRRGADAGAPADSPRGLTDAFRACPHDADLFRRAVDAAVSAGAPLEAASLADEFAAAAAPVRARAYAAAGRGEDALAALRDATDLPATQRVDGGLLALALGRTDDARAFAAAAAGRPDPAVDAALAGLRAEIFCADADFAAAEREARRALDLSAADGARAALANALGGARFRAGDHAEADRWFRLALDLCPDRGRENARALHNLGLVELRAGRHAGAVARLQEAVVEADALGEAFGAALARRSLAIALEYLGRYGASLEYAVEALDRLARLGREADLAAALLTVADLLATFGEWDRALALIGAAESRALSARLPRVVARCAFKRAECRLLRGDAAAADLVAAHAGLEAAGLPEQAVFCAARVAEAFLAEGDGDQALEWAERVIALGRSPADEATGRALLVRARNILGNGGPAQALADLAAARDALRAAAQREPLAETLRTLADATAALGDDGSAEALVEEARALVEDLAASVPAAHRNAFLARPSVARLAGPRSSESPRATIPQVAPIGLAARPRLRRLLPRIVGDSAGLQRVLVALERVRDVTMPVLLLGESGTGKELFAEAIHRLSPRSDGPFIRVNAAAFTDTLLLSELFGHERGAFTGAHARKIGKFEAAHGGTLFLDEIGDVSERLQTALLRVIEEQRFQRVGGTETVKVDVRLVFATNRDLDALRREGRFREDLFHRISGLAVPIPPLRDRAEDIPALASSFLDELEGETGRRFRIADDAMALLSAWRWPGNVRELRNVIRKTALLGDGDLLTRDDVVRENPEVARAAGRRCSGGTDPFDLVFGRGVSLFDARREVEVALIREALARTGGNISAAAQLLGMKRPRLSQMVKEYDLKVLPAATAREAQR